MEWLPLESSVFTSAAYDQDRQILYLRFHSREVYRYFDFSPAQYSRFLQTESKGKYFSDHIRDRFPCQRIGIARSS
jgi:KTSC domain